MGTRRMMRYTSRRFGASLRGLLLDTVGWKVERVTNATQQVEIATTRTIKINFNFHKLGG